MRQLELTVFALCPIAALAGALAAVLLHTQPSQAAHAFAQASDTAHGEPLKFERAEGMLIFSGATDSAAFNAIASGSEPGAVAQLDKLKVCRPVSVAATGELLAARTETGATLFLSASPNVPGFLESERPGAQPVKKVVIAWGAASGAIRCHDAWLVGARAPAHVDARDSRSALRPVKARPAAPPEPARTLRI